MEKILVTGGSGFIGINFLKSIAGKFSEIRSNYFKNEKYSTTYINENCMKL